MIDTEPYVEHTPWFDVAVMTSLLAAGDILLGHFEEHKAKWRRLLKVALLAGVTRN